MRESDIKKLNELHTLLREIEYIKYTLNGLLYWDKITKMPRGGIYYRSEVMAHFGEELYKKFSSSKLHKLVDYFEKNYGDDIKINSMIRRIKRNYIYVNQIPKKIYKEYISHISMSEMAWQEAKEKNDFSIFAPYLEKIICYFKEFAEYWGYKNDPYDALIEYYEDGITTELFDKLIPDLKKFAMETLKRIDLPKENKKQRKEFSFEKQKELSEKLLKIIGFDFQYGRVDISEHPTTLANSPQDVRVVTTFSKEEIFKGIYNTLHIGGKGIYEQDIDINLLGTLLGEVSTFALEEAEAKIYESIIGKDKNFCKLLLREIKNVFPKEYKDMTLEDIYKKVNKIEPSFIRIDADELTSILHIIIRYEIERDLINNKIAVKDLPDIWRSKYKEYLKIEPTEDSKGVLQDIHWAAGYFGYFPSYLLSGIYAGQIVASMNRELKNITENINEENLKEIHRWLKENIHRHGAVYTPKELIMNISKEEINSKYYIEYLRKKYIELYKI